MKTAHFALIGRIELSYNRITTAKRMDENKSMRFFCTHFYETRR